MYVPYSDPHCITVILNICLSVLKKWESEKLSLVIIEGSGEKAFCAGGDIRVITSDPDRGSVHQAEFFAEEYKLNNLVTVFIGVGCSTKA